MYLQQQSSQEDSAAERYEKSRRKFFEKIEGRSMCSIKQIEDLASAALEPFDVIKSTATSTILTSSQNLQDSSSLAHNHNSPPSRRRDLPLLSLGEDLSSYKRFTSPCEPLLPWTMVATIKASNATCDNIRSIQRPRSQTLLIENHNYASIVSKQHKFEGNNCNDQRNHQDDFNNDHTQLEEDDDLGLYNNGKRHQQRNLQSSFGQQSYNASIIKERDDLSLRDYVNLPSSLSPEQQNVEYATVRSNTGNVNKNSPSNAMILTDHDHQSAHQNHNHKQQQQQHDHYQKPQRHFNGSTSDVSFGEQSCSSSSNNSAKSGGFSMLPPFDCPSQSNKYESLVSGLKLANEESGCSRSTKSTAAANSSSSSSASLFKRFGSLVSKAFATNATATSQAQVSSGSLSAVSTCKDSTAGASLPATSKISELKEQAKREVGDEEKILHLNQENNNHVVKSDTAAEATTAASASLHETRKPPEETSVKSALVIECTGADQVHNRRRQQPLQREHPSQRRQHLPSSKNLDEADLVILPSKCVNQRTKLQAAAGKVQLQHYQNQKTNPIKSSLACRINSKLSRDIRERESRSRNRMHHRQRKQVINLSSSSSSVSSTSSESISSSSISISSASRPCATSPDSGHNRTTDSSRPQKSNSLSDDLESLMSKSSGSNASTSSSLRNRRNKHHLSQKLTRSLTINTKVPLLSGSSPFVSTCSPSQTKQVRPVSVADHIDCGTSAGGSDSGNSKSKCSRDDEDLEQSNEIKTIESNQVHHQTKPTNRLHNLSLMRRPVDLGLSNSPRLRPVESMPDLAFVASSSAPTTETPQPPSPPSGSRDSANYSDQVNGRNNDGEEDDVNAKDSGQVKTSKRSGKSKSKQSQPMSGFWGLASLMETSHGIVNSLDRADAGVGDKNSTSFKTTHNILDKKEKRKVGSNKKHGGGGHELLMNDYSNDSLEPQQQQQVAAGYTLYSPLALPQMMDKDLKANGKCQSLNLYQNLLRNYVKRSHKNSPATANEMSARTTAIAANPTAGHNRHNCHHRHSNHNHHNHHHQHHHHNHSSSQHHSRRSHLNDHRNHRGSSRGHACQIHRARSCSSGCNCLSADSRGGSGGSGSVSNSCGTTCQGKAQVWGQLIKINKSDGSQVVELHRAAGKSWGFFVARGTINNNRGIFISRMHDTLTSGALTGLLSIGDCILAIDDCVIGQDYDILRVNQMISKKSKILLRVKPFKG